MNTLQPRATATTRNGITLLEVMIALGILTVGLLSAAALIPAGRFQALKASIYDRSTATAFNAASDLINRGFLNVQRNVVPANPNFPQNPNQRFTLGEPILIFDPLYAKQSTAPWGPKEWHVNLADVNDQQITTSPFDIVTLNPNNQQPQLTKQPATVSQVTDIVFRSEDDIVYSRPDDDAPAFPQFSNGTDGRHQYDGNYSFLATLQTQEKDWRPGRLATLTVLTFHRRDTSVPPFALTQDQDESWEIPANSLPSDQAIKDVAPPGSMVLWCSDDPVSPTGPWSAQWLKVVNVAEVKNSLGNDAAAFAFQSQQTRASTNARLYVLPGAVAGVQMQVRLEGDSKWSP